MLEAVVVPGVGRESLDVNVDAVTVGLRRIVCAGLPALGEALVRGDLPLHRGRRLAHAPVEFEGLGSQAGPQDDRVGQGVARGDSEREDRS